MNEVIVKSTGQLTLRLDTLILQLESVSNDLSADAARNFLNGIIAKLLEAYQVISVWDWNALKSHLNGALKLFLDALTKVYETLGSFVTDYNWSSITDSAWDNIANSIEGIFGIVKTIQAAL
jgi:hypothetical protein